MISHVILLEAWSLVFDRLDSSVDEVGVGVLDHVSPDK